MTKLRRFFISTAVFGFLQVLVSIYAGVASIWVNDPEFGHRICATAAGNGITWAAIAFICGIASIEA